MFLDLFIFVHLMYRDCVGCRFLTGEDTYKDLQIWQMCLCLHVQKRVKHSKAFHI